MSLDEVPAMMHERRSRRRLLIQGGRAAGVGLLLSAAAGVRPARAQRAQLTLPDWPIAQGGAFFVSLSGEGIAGADVSFAGRTEPAVPDTDGWIVLFGVGQRVGLTEQHAPGSYPVRATVYPESGTSYALSGSVRVAATDFPVEALTFGAEESALLDPALTEREITVLRRVYAINGTPRLWEGYFLRPASGEITDVFGSRRSYNGGPAVGSHSGVDLGAPAAAPVRAAARGYVAMAAPMPVRGNMIILDHGAGVFTGYCHLSRIDVAEGQFVNAGERIALVGSTGLVTGPHLHWEVVVGGYHVDGLYWIA